MAGDMAPTTAAPFAPTAAIRRAMLILLLLVLGGVFLAYRFIAAEQERALQEWQVRLGLIADTRSSLVDDWARKRLRFLTDLAGNPSLQLYLSQLASRAPAENAAEPAQLSYLRNLIRAAAVRGGYGAPTGRNDVPANLASGSSAGLMLLNQDARPVVATAGMQERDADIETLARAVLQDGRPSIRDLSLDQQGRAVVGFMVPVYALAGADNRPVGVLYGLDEAARELYPLLRQEGLGLSSEETLLVRRDGDALQYLSPLADGSPVLQRHQSINDGRLAAAWAVKHAGGFGRQRDYAGQRVLVTSRQLGRLPWLLVQTIGEAEALRDYRERRNFLATSLLLLVAIVAALLVAAWKHGSGLRARMVADELRTRALELQAQWALLAAITDNIGELLFLLDSHARILFANRLLAECLRVDKDDLPGQSTAATFGPERGASLGALAERARHDHMAVSATQELELGGQRRTYHTTVLPLSIPGYDPGTVLVVAHDVSDLLDAQQKRGRVMSQLVSVLVRLIDLHDPHCIDHSVRTADVAWAIGETIGLSADELETLSMAARLANLGKIFVPRELLTKPGELNADERQRVLEAEQLAAETLGQLEFRGPVLEIIAQRQERVDGDGPAGLAGDGILMPARILAVANAYIAMTSERAYRPGLPAREALDQLLRDAGRLYDRGVVSALFNLVENRPQSMVPAWRRALPAGLGSRVS